MSFNKTFLSYLSLFILGALLMGVFLWYTKSDNRVLIEENAQTEVETSYEVLDSLTSQATSSLSKQEEEKVLNLLSSTSTEEQGSIPSDINSLEAQ